MSVFSSYVKKMMDNNKAIFGGSPETVVEDVEKEFTRVIDDLQSISPELNADEVDPDSQLGVHQQKRKKDRGRLAANLNPRSGASLLTSK